MSEINPQINGLSTLWQLGVESRAAESQRALGFIITNESRRLVDYQQAAFWESKGRNGRVISVSGVNQIDRHSDYVMTLRSVAAFFAAESLKQEDINQPISLSVNALPNNLAVHSLLHGELLWIPFIEDSQLIGGIILLKPADWLPNEMSMMKLLSEAYAYSWRSLKPKHSIFYNLFLFLTSRLIRNSVVLIFFVALWLPVSMSALAPAEVVAVSPVIVSSPYQGVFESFLVPQNSYVKTGDLLFKLNDVDVRNKQIMATKALRISKINLERASKLSFIDEDAKANLLTLQGEVEQKQAELDYAIELLGRINVTSPTNGVAIYSDPNEWLGRPLQTGERIMTIADPANVEVKLLLSVDDMIDYSPGARVTFFLNVDPMNPLEATVRQSTFTAKESSSGILSYDVKAHFASDTALPRIGLKGTAKLYGKKVTLFYYLFHRPVSWVRRTLGV